MAKTINIFDLLKDYYTPDDFILMFQQSLYKNYNIILCEDDAFFLYDDTRTYKKDDVVFTKRLGIYNSFISLVDNNNEPLNNSEAWEHTEDIIVSYPEMEALISIMFDIIPFSLINLYVKDDDIPAMNKLKYIIGLFIACYLGNKNGVFSNGEGGKIATSQSIDGLQLSYKVPDYLLKEGNLFYANNPYGLELLSLRGKLFIRRIVDTYNNLFEIPPYHKIFGNR